MLATAKTNKSINTLINYDKCTGLNITGTESVKEAFGFGGMIISNKGDPEIIIDINFRDNVNISGIMIESSMDSSKAPSAIQLFVNKNNLDFSDIGTVNPTESINLNGSLGKVVNLKVAKFRSVSSLVVKKITFKKLFFSLLNLALF
jgi:hypothetical protein